MLRQRVREVRGGKEADGIGEIVSFKNKVPMGDFISK